MATVRSGRERKHGNSRFPRVHLTPVVCTPDAVRRSVYTTSGVKRLLYPLDTSVSWGWPLEAGKGHSSRRDGRENGFGAGAPAEFFGSF